MEIKQIEVPETSGAKRKYDISGMRVGDRLSYDDTTTGKLLGSAKSFCDRHGLDWTFRCFTEDVLRVIIRTK